MDMTTAMQQMTGQARMQFRGVQGPAMAAIQQGRSPVVAIMPTGGGKSMLFMLPAWAVPGGTTIVVVPLISLRQDMARWCRQVGVSCVAWDWQRPPDEAAIVLVTPESAVTGDF
jgi:superfamily II DNA helicase RecQ